MQIIDVRFLFKLVNKFYNKPEHKRLENLFKGIEKSVSNSKINELNDSVEFYDNEKSTDTDCLDSEDFEINYNESKLEYLEYEY